MNAMNNEYVQARNEFDPIYYLIGFALFILLFCVLNKDGKRSKAKSFEDEDPRKRIFTKEELR